MFRISLEMKELVISSFKASVEFFIDPKWTLEKYYGMTSARDSRPILQQYFLANEHYFPLTIN
jgi:hypothetical protein